jgi:hypothetical protein
MSDNSHVYSIYAIIFSGYIVFFMALGFELRAYPWSHSTSPFVRDGYFPDRVSPTICPACPQTMILLVFVSLVAGIIGMSYQRLALHSSLS